MSYGTETLKKMLVILIGGIILFSPLSVFAEEKVLTLDQALSTALTGNPNIIVYRENANAAGYRINEARSGFMPQMAAVIGYKRATANSPAVPTLPSTDPSAAERESMNSFNNFSANLTLNQTIWDFGKTSGPYDSAKALKNSADADLRATMEGIYLTVTQSYFSVLAAQETMVSALETKKQMEKHLEYAQAQVAAGIRQKIDVTRAQSDLASANSSLVQAANALTIARLNLNTAMGTDERTAYTVVQPTKPAVPLEPPSEEMIQAVLENRSEYKSLRERIRAADGSLTAAKSGYYPILAANGAFGYTGYKIPELVYNWTIGASVTWNFFSGLYTMNVSDEASANLRSLRASLKALELSIRNEIQYTALSYKEFQERLAPAQDFLTTARETLSLAEERYKAGLGSIVEITDAQAVFTQAQTGLIQAQFNLETARAKLIKALGRISLSKNGG